MKKYLSCLLAALTATMVLTALTASAQSVFTDISDSGYAEAIDYLYSEGIADGYKTDDSKYCFKPDNPITRCEFTKLLAVSIMQNADEINKTEVGFSDLGPYDEGAWAIPYIAFAVEKNAVSGYPDNTFRPMNNVQLSEAVKMTVCVLGLDENLVSSSVWYEPYMEAAVSEGLLEGIKSTAQDNATRGDAAQLLYNMLKYKNGGIAAPGAATDIKADEYKYVIAEGVSGGKLTCVEIGKYEKQAYDVLKNLNTDYISGGNIIKLGIKENTAVEYETVYANGALSGSDAHIYYNAPDGFSAILGTMYEITENSIAIAPNFTEVSAGGHGVLNIDNLKTLSAGDGVCYIAYDSASKSIVQKYESDVNQGVGKTLIDQKATTRAVVVSVNDEVKTVLIIK